VRVQRQREEIERLRLARDFAEGARTYRTVADRLPIMMWVARSDGVLEYCNGPWLRYTGGRTAPRGWKLMDVLHPDDKPGFVSRWSQCGEHEEEMALTVRLRRCDGAFRWHVVQAQPIPGLDTLESRWCGTCTDIDDLKRAEAAAREAEQRAEDAGRRAEEANRLKDEFLATVSHELRTPLQVVLGWTRLLSQGAPDEGRRARGLAIIARNAEAQARLVDDLLDVSQITAGKLRIERTRVDLAAVLESAVEAVRLPAEAKGLRIERAVAPGPSIVLGDPDRLRQILSNLLANAVKFTHAGRGESKIRVTLRRADGCVELCVEDTGEGIAPEFLPHVFEPFRQADGSTTRRHGGFRLGLSIVRHLVALHDGAIGARSDGEGKGATFVVVLPLAPPSAAIERAPDVMPPDAMKCPEALAGLKVLVVDDEQDAREMLREVLQACRAEVEIAASVAEGLALIQRMRPDVLLSDIAMPGEDGLTLIRKVRALPPQEGGRIGAVAVTALSREEDRARVLEAGFDFYVCKPVEPAVLFAAVGRFTGRSQVGPSGSTGPT
jgi:PAS domain S-box-containing protein